MWSGWPNNCRKGWADAVPRSVVKTAEVPHIRCMTAAGCLSGEAQDAVVTVDAMNLTLALHLGECWASRYGRLTTGERARRTCWIKGQVNVWKERDLLVVSVLELQVLDYPARKTVTTPTALPCPSCVETRPIQWRIIVVLIVWPRQPLVSRIAATLSPMAKLPEPET